MIHPMLGEAWLAMGANRLRTALTMLGMVIGVGAVVIMLAIGQGAQYAVQQTISTMGSNLFIVLSGSFTTSGVRSGSAGAPTTAARPAERTSRLGCSRASRACAMGLRQMLPMQSTKTSRIIGAGRPGCSGQRRWAARG